MLLNITGGEDLSLFEVNEAAGVVGDAADDDANIIFGAVVDERLKGKISITVVATGFGDAVSRPLAQAAPEKPRGLADTVREAPSEPAKPFGRAPSFDSGDFEIPSFVRQPEE